MKTFAIVIICYRKLNGIKRLLKSLEQVNYDGRNDIHLIFSVDYSYDNEDVRDFVENYKWHFGNKSTIKYTENQGLKKHIIACGDLTSQFDILVVLEDDLYVSNSMYNYSYNAAMFYYEDENIAGISLYNFNKNWLNTIHPFNPEYKTYDTYFMKIAQSWGQVWTSKKWGSFKRWYNQKDRKSVV